MVNLLRKHFAKLDNRGISHLVVPLVVVVLVAAVGTFMLVASHANSRNTPRQSYATAILKQANKGHIDFVDTGFRSIDERANTTPRENLRSAMHGEQSKTTRHCEGRDGVAGPYDDVAIGMDTLRFMLALSKRVDYKISSIVGQCHSSASSKHYTGDAVDIACPVSPGTIDIANKIGKRYGFSHNSEDCKHDGHFHFSKGGN